MAIPNSVQTVAPKPSGVGSAGGIGWGANAQVLKKDLASAKSDSPFGEKAENAAELKDAQIADALRGEANSTSSALVPEGSSDGLAKDDDMVATSKTKTLTLAEQKTLAAYCQYTLPKFYIPPLLVSDTSNKKQEKQKAEASEMMGFIFVNIGDLKVEDTTFPRNLPILKVPDADIDAVQDMGFGCGNIKVSGRLWGEAGYARLQTLRELCKSRRPLIFISQETGPWYVMPQNVPGINTAADKPYQYFFDVTFVCVAQLNAEDPTIQQYAKMRRELVRKKFNREMAVIRAQNAIKEKVKNFDTITGAGSGVQKGFYYDAVNGTASYNPDLQELANSDFTSRTSGAGGMLNDESTKTGSSTYAESQEQKLKNINPNAKEIIARTDAAMGNAQQGNTSKDKSAGMLSNLLPGGGGRNEQAPAEKVKNVIPVSAPKVKPSENPNYKSGLAEIQQMLADEARKTELKKVGGGGASW